MNPINLKTEFGDKWQIGLDEAANGRSDDPWNYVVRCRYGHLYPVDEGRIGAATDCTGVTLQKLAAMGGACIFFTTAKVEPTWSSPSRNSGTSRG